VASGVLVPAILSAGRLVWNRRRVPTALARSVRRQSYLVSVLAESTREDVRTLDVLAPRLTSADDNETIRQIQSSWKRINAIGRVRVLTLDSEECLKGGAELAEDIEVRIGRRDLGSEGLSYLVFGLSAGGTSTVIVNYHQDTADRPVRLTGTAPAQVFRDHFDAAWNEAKPLESVLAERIIANAGRLPDAVAVARALTDARASLKLSPGVHERVLAHVAVRHSFSVMFVVGLPGVGKSLVRRRLASRLRAIGIETCELSDYVYAYRDFLHGRIQLQPPRGQGFHPHDGGAFAVGDEVALMPALQALAQAVREGAKEQRVALVEFARVDLVTALQEFDELRCRSMVIHVDAPKNLRAERLSRRAEPPDLTIDGQSVRLLVSDNHALPSTISQELYRADDIDRLTGSPRWRDRIFRIDNSVDDGGARIDARLQSLIERVVGSYRANTVRPTTAQPSAVAHR
jgi:hypothetical protein